LGIYLVSKVAEVTCAAPRGRSPRAHPVARGAALLALPFTFTPAAAAIVVGDIRRCGPPRRGALFVPTPGAVARAAKLIISSPPVSHSPAHSLHASSLAMGERWFCAIFFSSKTAGNLFCDAIYMSDATKPPNERRAAGWGSRVHLRPAVGQSDLRVVVSCVA